MQRFTGKLPLDSSAVLLLVNPWGRLHKSYKSHEKSLLA